MIDAPHAASSNRKIQEHEAVDDSQLTGVYEGKEAPQMCRLFGGARTRMSGSNTVGRMAIMSVCRSLRGS
jgi:hypothetical protein